MRVQSLLSALASIALLGAAALLAATAPSRAIQIFRLPISHFGGDADQAFGGCGIAAFSRPNLEIRSGYARPTLTSPAAARCADERAHVSSS